MPVLEFANEKPTGDGDINTTIASTDCEKPAKPTINFAKRTNVIRTSSANRWYLASEANRLKPSLQLAWPSPIFCNNEQLAEPVTQCFCPQCVRTNPFEFLVSRKLERLTQCSSFSNA